MTLPPPTPQPGLVTNPFALNALEESDLEVYYYVNAFDSPCYSGSAPDPSTVKRFLSKEQYDEMFVNENESMMAQKSVFAQQVAVQQQSDQAEKDEILALIAEATGLTLEQLKKVL